MRNPLMIGERVYLRPLEVGDADELARQSATETETFFDWGRIPLSPIGLRHWIAELYKRQPPEIIQLAVCTRDDDRLLGYVGLWDLDWVNRTAETESFLGLPEYRGKGYGTEAKHLLLEYAFDRLQLQRLYSEVWEPNTRSAAAVLKQGYRPAGRRKTTHIKNGAYADLLVFDICRDEWLAAREEWRSSRLVRAAP